jgi:phage tail-like protein
VISLDIDVPLSMFFAVEIEGEVNSGFKTATGLGTRTREYVIRQGNAEDIALPIGHEPGTVTLTAGYAFSDLLWEWSEKVHKWQRGDKDPRRAVSIIQLYKPQHPLALEIGPMALPSILSVKRTPLLVELRRWILHKAWPVEFSGPDFDSDSDMISVQSLVLRYKGRPDIPYPMGERLGMVGDALKNAGVYWP